MALGGTDLSSATTRVNVFPPSKNGDAAIEVAHGSVEDSHTSAALAQQDAGAITRNFASRPRSN